MALSYKARRRWSLVVLLIGLPVYIVTAVWVMSFFETRPHIVIEVLIYLGLGVIWAFPLKAVFMGVGQADPDQRD
ncbi:MAG: hypothetical protein ACI84R_003722 [Candidatus Azotimanducaceae bacterium]|jgi:hypothetical protein|tara:strand:+ start:1275 stop:1499 length:225 start_codon:yes stop_codon:yes gene_type:complete